MTILRIHTLFGILVATLLAACGPVLPETKPDPVVEEPEEVTTTTEIPAPIEVTGIIITGQFGTPEGERSRLTAHVYPTDASDDSITWSSDNTSVATVDHRGYVEGIMTGSVIISATANDASKTVSSVTFLVDGDQDDDKIVDSLDPDDDNDGTPDEQDRDKDDDGWIDIANLNELHDIRHNLMAEKKDLKGVSEPIYGFELVRSLDFQVAADYAIAASRTTFTTGTGFTPIGDDDEAFAANFKGNGYTINNLYINDSTADNAGLFGVTTGQPNTISNVKVHNAYVVGKENTGILVGYNDWVALRYVESSGTVSGSTYTGGLVGRNKFGPIANAFSTAMVSNTTPANNVGGLVGSSEGGTMDKVFAAGSVTGKDHTGGLVGHNAGNIQAAYASGSVTGSNNVGGLVGTHIDGNVRDAYADGHVTGQTKVGGLVGYLSGGTYSNTFALGPVTGTSEFGGLMGDVQTVFANTATFSYWNTETTLLTVSEVGTAVTTTAMQSVTSSTGIFDTYTDIIWDFGTTEQYPAIKTTPGGITPQR